MYQGQSRAVLFRSKDVECGSKPKRSQYDQIKAGPEKQARSKNWKKTITEM